MPTTIFGAFRTDSTMTDAMASFATAGSSFQISAYSQITISDGADATVIEGDSIANENPNDPTQTYLGNAIYWDYTIQVNDGVNTYNIGIFDYDINGNGNSVGTDAEDGFFIGFVDGQVPPLNTTLTFGPVQDNGPEIDVDTVVPCFTAGTRIATPSGPCLVEDLRPGDLVETADHGMQPVRWVGQRTLDADALKAAPKLRPVRISAGALGLSLPRHDLVVSRQHRMLIRSPIAKRMFDTSEILVPAIKLVEMPGVFVDESAAEVTYVHVLFDAHEIIFAEDAPSESLFTGPQALASLGDAAVEEITALFPELLCPDHSPSLARHVPVRAKQTKRLLERHIQNDKPLLGSR